MGLLIDTGVLIRIERSVAVPLDFSPWERYGDAAISVVTASELLVGVHRAVPEVVKRIVAELTRNRGR